MSRSHVSPVIEHNSHAYPTIDLNEKALVPKGDMTKLPPPKTPSKGKDSQTLGKDTKG